MAETDMSEDGSITTETRGRLLLIGLNRPKKLNGLTPTMMRELAGAFTRLDEEDALWAGVVFAHGPHFCAGLDLPKFSDSLARGEFTAVTEDNPDDVDPFALKRKCRKPLVCAVGGVTFTAGLELMLACDIAVAGRDVRFSQLEPKRGIMAVGGATFRFVERCGWGNAMYLLLRAHEFGAEEALRYGFVQEIVEPGAQLDRAVEIAEEIAANAPLAVMATKASSMAYAEGGEAAAIATFGPSNRALAGTYDVAEGRASFKERRPAKFEGR